MTPLASPRSSNKNVSSANAEYVVNPPRKPVMANPASQADRPINSGASTPISAQPKTLTARVPHGNSVEPAPPISTSSISTSPISQRARAPRAPPRAIAPQIGIAAAYRRSGSTPRLRVLISARQGGPVPTYEYTCASCDTKHDIVQRMTDPTLTDCPSCGKPTLRKVFGGVGVVFKGSGFYRTDSRSGDKKSESGGSSGSSDSSSGSSSSTASKGEKKKDSGSSSSSSTSSSSGSSRS